MNGATFVAGRVGQAFSFDGVDDYVEVAHSNSLNLTSGLTLQTWFKFRELSAHSTLFSKADADGTQSLTSYALQINSDGAINVALYGTYPADNWTTASGLVVAGQWYHITLTWDGSYDVADNVKLYLNGTLVQTWTKSPAPLNETTQSLTLGSMKPPTYHGRMNGLIDEAAIFNRALTANEILAIYEAGSGGQCDVPPLYSDVVVRSLTLDKSNYRPGETATATVVIKNQGTTSTGSGFSVSLYRDGAASISCGAAGDSVIALGHLAAGATASFTMTFTIPATPGNRIARLFADADCAIAEYAEANNQGTVSYFVAGPDLRFSKVTMNKATFTPGEIGSVTLTVQNVGSLGTGVGYTVRLYRNSGTFVNCATSYSAFINRPSLSAGGSDTFVMKYTNPTFEGLFVLRVFVDATCAVAETDEGGLQQVVRFYAVSNGPSDLELTNIELNKTTYGAGELGTATVTVSNIGTGSTLGKYNTGLYINLPTTAGCSTTTYKTIPRSALGGGSLATFPISFITPLTNGAFTMRAFADNSCSITEISEANNQATAGYSVVVSAADLVIDSVMLNKTTYGLGEKGTATVTVRNAGGTSTGVPFTVILARHSPTELGCNPANYNGITIRKALRPAAVDTFGLPFTAPTVGGTYVLRIFADSACVATESNETNNQSTVNYNVSGALFVPLENSGTPTEK